MYGVGLGRCGGLVWEVCLPSLGSVLVLFDVEVWRSTVVWGVCWPS